MLEHDEYSDEAAYLIVDADRNVIVEDVYDGWDAPELLDKGIEVQYERNWCWRVSRISKATARKRFNQELPTYI